ncbi:cupin domain-containing protein [Acididesulfobacillus acetoxydans]|nr:cupin domain-containing protein [Acididesulfobacillus acetoxydans]
MIRKASEMRREGVKGLRGGQGKVEITHILEEGKGEFAGKGRLFAKNVLEPGASIGLHEHMGDFEVYFILSGTGTINDNGVKSSVGTGDMVLTRHGESHALENTGDTDLVLLSLILFDSKA